MSDDHASLPRIERVKWSIVVASVGIALISLISAHHDPLTAMDHYRQSMHFYLLADLADHPHDQMFWQQRNDEDFRAARQQGYIITIFVRPEHERELGQLMEQCQLKSCESASTLEGGQHAPGTSSYDATELKMFLKYYPKARALVEDYPFP